jgi:hypothetical protein
MLTRAQVIEQVTIYVDATSYPTLSAYEIGNIVDGLSRWTTWTANTSYGVYDRVIPTVYNGRIYEALLSGTSGTTDPFPQRGNFYEGYNFYDMNILWSDAGPAHQEKYPVMHAISKCWHLKASRVATEIDAIDGQADVKMSQLLQHCLKMAAKYREVTFI